MQEEIYSWKPRLRIDYLDSTTLLSTSFEFSSVKALSGRQLPPEKASTMKNSQITINCGFYKQLNGRDIFHSISAEEKV